MLIAIYGLGLIGGSLGRAITKNTAHEVIGCDINRDSVLKAKLLNAIEEEIDEENIKNADAVFLALNPSAAVSVMKSIVPKLKKGAALLDCCGNKRGIVAEMEKLKTEYPDINFIGAHPMAGREFWGISHSTASLFEHAFIILTPVNAPIEILCNIKSFFKEIGFEDIIVTSPARHDEVIAYTSQLAHVVSSAYIKSPTAESYLGFSAGSFRDMTRVAKLNPEMWAELMLGNRDNLLAEIEVLKKNITEYESALKENDEGRLRELLEDGSQKKEICERQRRERKND